MLAVIQQAFVIMRYVYRKTVKFWQLQIKNYCLEYKLEECYRKKEQNEDRKK